MRPFALCLVVLLAGCRGCVEGTGGVVTEPVRVSDAPLRFTDTWVGSEGRLELELTNPTRVSQTVPVHVDAPFFLEFEDVVVAAGSTERLNIIFRPATGGEAAGVLTVDQTRIEVSGLGLEVPMCVATTVCESASFDREAAQCLVTRRPDGVACLDQCITAGQCQAGECVGAPVDCSDADACTLDSCGSQGCAHTPRTCSAPSNPCKVAVCDSTTGCGEADVDDGTVCGPDACTDAQVSVCITGQCVARPRPVTERCSRTWVPLRLPAQGSPSLAYDPVRRQLLTWVGRQTWVWDGTDWSQRFPPAAPPAGAMAFATDTRRNRVVAFVVGETWEWDGFTWLLRAAATLGPGARYQPALSYDPVRGVTVLFGGMGAGSVPLGDTWEWNGVRWALRATAHAPSARFGAAMAWDPSRSSLLLFAGTFDYFVGSSDTWAFDGTDWVQRTFTPTPPPRYATSLTWDAVRSVFVVVAGTAYDPLDDIWELGAAGWSMRGRTPERMQSHGAVWDPARARVVVLNEGITYEWNGQTLVPAGRAAPATRWGPSAAFDVARGRITLFGGHPTVSAAPSYPSANDTWVRDATSWVELNLAVKPAPRYSAAFVWDPVRQRLLLFGGTSEINSQSGIVGQRYGDTWSFDGASWTQLLPTTAPTSGASAGTWDEANQRVVVLAGATWGFDGAAWSMVAPASPPNGSTLAFDPASQQLLAVNRDQTWALIANTWTQRMPATPLPSTFTTGRLAWDPSRQRVVLQGDRGTFAWDGADWSNLQPTAQPFEPPEALVFDAARNRLVAITRGGEWTFLP